MIELRIGTKPAYGVQIGPGALEALATETARFSAAAVLTDRTVEGLHAGALGPLSGAPRLAVEPGESSKGFATLEQVLDFLASCELDRGAVLVAFGGGVVGDLGGLAASLYLRGIACVQAPTTLLAQVDSSVGGKTAVNLRAGKNLAGTFHQPSAVLADTLLLATLTDAEYRSGLGEVVKAALIEGEEALAALERGTTALRAREPSFLAETVARCVHTKAMIVARDPHEQGERKLLNLGHTFAHAIERTAGYGRVPHGVAVACGLALAARTARALGRLDEALLPERIVALLAELGLPGSLSALAEATGTALPPRELVAAMRHDKKNERGRIRLVLPLSAGVLLQGVEAEERWLEDLLAAD